MKYSAAQWTYHRDGVILSDTQRIRNIVINDIEEPQELMLMMEEKDYEHVVP